MCGPRVHMYSLIPSNLLHTCFYCLAWHNTPINYVRCAVFSCFTRKGCLAKCLAQKVIGSTREITGLKKYEIHSAENAVPTYWTSKIWQTTKLNNEYLNPKVLSYRTKQAESNICSTQILQWLQLKSFQNVIDSSHSCARRVWRKKHALVFAVFTSSWKVAARLGALTDYWLEWMERDHTSAEPHSDPLIVGLIQHLSYPICTWLSRTHGQKVTHDGSTATIKELWQLTAALHVRIDTLHCDQYKELPSRLKQTVLAQQSSVSQPFLCSGVVFHSESVLSISRIETFFIELPWDKRCPSEDT